MPALAIDHYNIRAPQPLLDALRDFYCAAVGLRVGSRPLRSSGYWLYAGEKDVLHLSQTRAGEVRQTQARPTFDHVAFACTDFDAMRDVLEAAGIEHSIEETPARGQRQVFFRDPAGNGVELNFKMPPR